VLAQFGRRVGDPIFGISIARASPIGSLGTFDYAVWASATVREALTRSIRIYEYVARGLSMALMEDGGVARLQVRAARPGPPATVLVDFVFALQVMRIRETRDGTLRPIAVRVRHGVTDRAAAESFFGVAPSFDDTCDEYSFDAALLDGDMLTSDPRTAALLEAHAHDSIVKMHAGDPILERVRATIAAHVDAGQVELSHVAAELGQSERTLQRLLQARHTSLRRLVDEVRHQLALARLADPRASTVYIARDLGFAKPQAFYRAFQRWTGMTPAQFRATGSR
jgi:AraC-like DNA-binding protein